MLSARTLTLPFFALVGRVQRGYLRLAGRLRGAGSFAGPARPLFGMAAWLGVLVLSVHALLAAEIKQIKRPIAEIDAAEVSAPYRAALQMARGFPANVRLSFLGEDRIALSSMDGFYAPSFGHVATRKFHFTVDVFELTAGTLNQANALRFDTETSDARFAALPSGKLLVDTGQIISALDQSGHVSVERSVAEVCGSPAGLELKEPFRTNLLAASEDVAFVGLARAGRSVPPDGPPIPIDNGWGCWFSTTDLRPIAQTRSKRAEDGTAARGLVVYLDYSWRLTPDDQHPLSIPPSVECNVPEWERRFPRFFLLHAEHAEFFRCRKGTITIKRGDQISTLTLKGAEQWYFRTDAWNVPLAIFVGGSFHVPLLWGRFTGTTKTRLVNYKTGSSAALPELKINAPAGVYAGETLEYAISPGGHYVAVLHGSRLAVYEVPPQLLK